MPTKLLYYNNFSGGFRDAPSDNLKDSELRVAQNIVLVPDGGFESRKGANKKLNLDSYNAEIKREIEWVVNGEPRSIVILDDNKMYQRDIDTGVLTEKQQLASSDVEYLIIQKKLYVMDGDDIYVWGDYDYLANSTQDIKIGDIVLNTPKSSGSGIAGHFYRSIVDHTSTNLTTEDYANSANWEDVTDVIDTLSSVIRPVKANLDAENDLVPIRKCTMFVQHPLSLRVFACGNPSDPLALYYSETMDISFFKATNKLYPQNNEGKITAIASVFDKVVISYNNSWWMWSGIDPTQDATWSRLAIPYGCTSHKSIELTPFSFTYLSASGIKNVHASVINQNYLMVQNKDTIRDLTTDKAERIIKDMVHPETACSIFYDNKYFLAYGDDPLDPYNNKVLVYDWEIRGFTIYTGWQVNSWTKRSDGTLTFSTKNYILETYSGLNDVDVATGDEKAIEIEVKTRGYDLNNPLQAKDLWFLYVQTKQITEAESYMDVSVEIDYKESSFKDVPLTESLIWGVTSWGNKWGYRELIERLAEIKEIGSRFSVTFKCNKLNSPIAVHAIGFRFKPLMAKTPMLSDSYVRRLLN